jgi:predicted metal-dependent phosphoesterase TrpH
MILDLHTHTTASDGTLPPEELVKEAKNVNVSALGITDHDTTEGLEKALKAGEQYGVEIVPGIEINTDHDGTEIHVLGYFMNYKEKGFQDSLQEIRNERLVRAWKILEKLRKLGLDVNESSVMDVAQGQAVCRPHIARALVEAGFCVSVKEAFDKYLKLGGKAYVPRNSLAPREAINLIGESGGVPVLAHPGLVGRDGLIPSLVDSGLEGIEVYYSRHSPEMIKNYSDIAKQYQLIQTGGSDYHGPIDGLHGLLGTIKMPDGILDDLKKKMES